MENIVVQERYANFKVLSFFNMATLGVVPEEVVDHIVSFLDAPALMACELVCRQWYRIARVSPAWRRIAQAMSLDGVPQPSFLADVYPLGASFLPLFSIFYFLI